MYYSDETMEALKLDSELYNAIRAAFDGERFDANGDAIKQFCAGVHMAIMTVYNMGFSSGYRAGVQNVRDIVANNGAADNALKNFQDDVASSYELIRRNIEKHGKEGSRIVNDAILNRLKDNRNTVKNIIINECDQFRSI